MAISDVLELKAVLDAGAFNSLLTMSVQTRRRGSTSIFVFQCDDVRVSGRRRLLQHYGITSTLLSFIFPSATFRLTLFNEIFHGHF